MVKERKVVQKVSLARSPGRRRFMLLLAVGLIVGGAITWLVQDHVLGTAEPHLYAVGDVPAADCILVPGARIYSDGEPYPMLVDRLAVAKRLFESGKAPRVLVSGRGGGSLGVDEVASMRRWLERHGVPADCIQEDPVGLRTLDSLLHCRDVYQHRSVIVASNDFHVPRMIFLGLHFGLETHGVVAPPLHQYSLMTLIKNRGREVLARGRACLDAYWTGVK